MNSISTKIVSLVRCYPVLLFLKNSQNIRFFRKITRYFDPNYLRRNTLFYCRPCIKIIRWKNIPLYVDVNDHIGFWSFFRNEPFELAVYYVAKSIGLTAQDVILDIGANIGHASVPICAELGCELVAVEASKENAILLLKNIQANNVRAHVIVAGVTSDVLAGEYLELYVRSGNRGANSLVKTWSPSKAGDGYELVPTTTLDDIIEGSSFSNRIGLIKIDVEGFELEVIQGGQRFFEKNTAPILMEYRVNVDKATTQKLAEVLSLLSNNYKVSALDKAWNKIEFDPRCSYENVLFERKVDV